jgi:MerR family transcriptional regulator, light-induced transcriptional regulator
MSIGELARRAEVSPDTLRAWERRYGLFKPRRTSGNRRMYSRADEVRVRMMRRYLAVGKPTAVAAEMVSAARLSVDEGPGASVEARDVRAAHEELRRALDHFQETAAQRVLERLFVTYSRLAVIRDVLLPYLREVGERWAEDHITVAQEHFTSTFLEARFMAMARGWDHGPGPRALLACPAGERHVFGLVTFGIALHDAGWRITYLGADTPSAMVRYAASAIDPDLIVLAAVLPKRFPDEDEMRTLTRQWTCAIAGAGATSELSTRLMARQIGDDPITAAETVHATWPWPRHEAVA